MRVFLFVLVLVPVIASAQLNRSAAELARDNARDYLKTKIFRNQEYTPVSYSDLKPYTGKNLEIFWVLHHRFEITEIEAGRDTNTVYHRPYKFVFYMDRKMGVLKAESAYVE